MASLLGKKTPLDQKPELGLIGDWYYEAYILLCNSKNMDGRIPASEIYSFIKVVDIIDPPEVFYKIITYIDYGLTEKE